MARQIKHWMCVIAVSLLAAGCGPTPVVVTPDADRDTTVIKEREIEVRPADPAMPAPERGPSVGVDVGGGGVDVNVKPSTEAPK